MLPNLLSFLVVEDHEFQRAMLVKMLKGLNAKKVYTAADGRAALELLRTLDTPPDVIISDLDMPAMDGMELMRHIGAARSGASLIVASALERNVLSSVETMATAYGINFLGTIEKPVTPLKLEELILVHKPAAGRATRAGRGSPIFAAEEIVDGLENNEFEAYFQPKVEIATGRVDGRGSPGAVAASAGGTPVALRVRKASGGRGQDRCADAMHAHQRRPVLPRLASIRARLHRGCESLDQIAE